MTDQNNNSPPAGPMSRRRSSFAGQAFADLFGGGRNRAPSMESSNSPPGQYSGPITSAAAQANQRRLSVTTTLGLGASPPGGGSLFGGRARGDSIASSNNASTDESAVEEDPASAGPSQPTTPFARRVSFGARAMRDLNKSGGSGSGSNGSNGRLTSETIPEEYNHAEGVGGGGGGGKQGRSSPIDVAGSAKTTVPTTAKGRGESGFNWADNMRTRAERTSIGNSGAGSFPPSSHHRAKSVAVMEQPIREAPKPARVLDHTQERILKGDFYMD